MHHQRRRQILVRWFGVRRWVVAASRESWTTDRRNGNNDTTKSKCNNSYKGNMHQCGGSSRNGTCSKFRISGATLFWTSLDRFRSLQQKGTGTQRIRVGGWMSVCVLVRWERLVAITAASILAAAVVAPVAVRGLRCEPRRFPAAGRPDYNWPLLELSRHCSLDCKFLD